MYLDPNTGSITLSAKDDTYLKTGGSSDLVEKLFSDWTFNKVHTSNPVKVDVENSKSISSDTKLKDIKDKTFTPGELNILDGNGDIVETITLGTDDTIGNFATEIQDYFNLDINTLGQVIISAKNDGYTLVSSDSDPSNVLEVLGINPADFASTITYTSEKIEAYTESGALENITEETKLSDLGVTASGNFQINGTNININKELYLARKLNNALYEKAFNHFIV